MRKIVSIKYIEPFPLYDISVEDEHCFELVNGVIVHNSMYSHQVISGGSGSLYSANQAFIISKAQEKDGTDLVGWKFTINIEKSRFVREKEKFPFRVLFNKGISRYSGLLDIALELGFVFKPSMGWYNRLIDGKPEEKKWRAKETDCLEFWGPLLGNVEFNEAIRKRYKVAFTEDVAEENIEEIDQEAE